MTRSDGTGLRRDRESRDDLPFPGDLPLSQRIHRVLGATASTETPDRALARLAGRLASDGDRRAMPIVEDLLALAFRSRVGAAADAMSLALLLPCCLYLAVVGKHGTLFSSVAAVLTKTERAVDPRLRFRAYRLAFAVAVGRGDLKTACRHAERAYESSLAAGLAAIRFEGLALVVLLLEAMGLLRDARALAKKLDAWGGGDDCSAALRLANAIHGLRIAQRLDDVESAVAFHASARRAVECAAVGLGPVTRATFDAASAIYQAWIGRPRVGLVALEASLARAERSGSKRALALVRCARAEVTMAAGECADANQLSAALTDSLADFAAGSAIHRDILRTMARTRLGRSIGDEPQAAAMLERDRDRPADGRQASIALDFLWWTADEDDIDETRGARKPHDPHPDPLAANEPSFAEIGFDFDGFIDGPDRGCAAESEASLRTAHYDIAESWAVAAEIAAGGSGRQCFKVGRVAAAMGAALGFPDERCVALDMACRLRDIGRVAVARAADADAVLLDATAALAERARAGERMLSFSNDFVLRSAARIALCQRAWWNGSGFPVALVGDEIPIEARICAVADALVRLVDPIERGRRWTIEEALRQIGCLAGAQFDPSLVDLLDRALRGGRTEAPDAVLPLRGVANDNPVGKAKRGLFESLELAFQ